MALLLRCLREARIASGNADLLPPSAAEGERLGADGDGQLRRSLAELSTGKAGDDAEVSAGSTYEGPSGRASGESRWHSAMPIPSELCLPPTTG